MANSNWRRRDIQRMTPAELKIRDAILEIEKLPADIRLSSAVVKLLDATELVGDFVDGFPKEEA